MNLRSWISGGRRGKRPEYLALPLELEDGPPARFHRSMLRICALVIVTIGIWASITPIRELAIAPGQILPKGDVRSVQHLEGGIVAEILVQAGDRVAPGTPLLRLANEQAGHDLAQLKVRAEALRLQKQQIAALLTSTALDLRPSVGIDPELAAAQRSVFDTRLQARLDEGRTLESRIQQRRAEIDGVINEIDGYKRLVAIQEERMRTRGDLLEKGLTTRREFLADKAALEQARSQQTNAEGRLATLRQQLSEAENQYVSAEGEARRLWSEENSRIGAELSEATEAIAKLEDRVRRLTIRAPSEGVVQFVLPRSPGEVVKPGDTVARIVPVDAPLLAEVEIRADDIGHVKVGDPAELRVSTYDPSVFGKLHGKVVSLSPSTFQRQNGDYFFKATISLDEQTLAGVAAISPGMVVSAEIVTGAKSFARYLLKPVFKTLGPAFSEK